MRLHVVLVLFAFAAGGMVEVRELTDLILDETEECDTALTMVDTELSHVRIHAQNGKTEHMARYIEKFETRLDKAQASLLEMEGHLGRWKEEVEFLDGASPADFTEVRSDVAEFLIFALMTEERVNAIVNSPDLNTTDYTSVNYFVGALEDVPGVIDAVCNDMATTRGRLETARELPPTFEPKRVARRRKRMARVAK